MPVEYRNMLPSDEEAILDLWLETWKGAERERARAGIRADTNLEQHTFIAVGDDRSILAATHYWLHLLRDAQGVSRPVGCVSHVATRETARRQGHARTLMGMT